MCEVRTSSRDPAKMLKLYDKGNYGPNYHFCEGKCNEICLKTEFPDGRNMEAIQHITLKFGIGDLLTICYLHVHTQFRPNLKGSSFFFVFIE